MILLVDGYNFIKGIFPFRKGCLEECRQQLIRLLSQYRILRANRIKEIIAVFDGGLFQRATREVHRGIVVLFAGRSRSADDWIVEYAESHKGYQTLVVSNDRELRKRCVNVGCEVIKIDEFDCRVREALRDFSEEQSKMKLLPRGGVTKFEREEGTSLELDLLMEQASLGRSYKNDDAFDENAFSKEREKKLSKKEKKRQKVLKKL
jgi:predicted RNA-binding protein with PIN domain